MGYNTKEIKVGKQKVIAVTLAESAEQLETVVVTAFGANQKKESVTGAIQAIKPADLIVPSSNLSTSFAGRLAGVVAFQRSGEPGSNNAEFFIRGISTISGITSPLIIMDGVEITSADLNAIDPVSYTHLLNGIAYKKASVDNKKVSVKGLTLAISAGFIMAFFYRFVAASIDLTSFEHPAAGKMTPYTAVFILSLIHI